MTARFLAIVNPAAGGGKCGRLAAAALDRVRGAGVDLEVALTNRAGEATELTRRAYHTRHDGIFSQSEATALHSKS